MMRGFARIHRLWRAGRAWPRRLTVGVGALSLVVGPVGLAAWGDGYERVRVPLSSGGAWLASPAQSIVTLIDGASEQVVGSVWVPPAMRGSGLSVVQSGSSAYLANPAVGAVARIDAATLETSAPVKFGDGSGSLDVLTSERAAYVLDGGRRVVSVADPTSLRLRGEPLSLAARPGPGQAVVDEAGRLWVVDRDRGGLTWFDGGKRVRPEVAEATSRLVLVQGRPVLVDPVHARVGALSPDGAVGRWSCLDVQPTDQMQVLGAAGSARVFTAVAGTGTLLVSAVDRDDCSTSVTVGKPGDRFGPLVESAGFVFVPNWSSGNTMVIDVNAARVAATFQVGKPGSRLELVAKDGFVFYNDIDGDRAGVIRLDGGQWRLGKSLQKFDRADIGKGILTPTEAATGLPLAAVTPSSTPSPSSSSQATSSEQNNAPPPPDKTPTQDRSPSDGSSSPSDPSPTSTPPTSPPPTSPPPGKPNIVRLTASDPTPGVGATVTFSATETGAGKDAIWTWSVTQASTGEELGSEQKPAGAKFSWKFTDLGSYQVRLKVTFQGNEDDAAVSVKVSDQCALGRAVANPVVAEPDLWSYPKVTLRNCSTPQKVTVTADDWMEVTTPSFTLEPGQKEGSSLFGQAMPPKDGVNRNAVRFRLANGRSVSFDIKVNLDPRFVSKPSCGSGSDTTEFRVAIADGDLRNLAVTLHVGDSTWRMNLGDVSGDGEYATFVRSVPTSDIPAGEDSFQVSAVDSGGRDPGPAKGFACW